MPIIKQQQGAALVVGLIVLLIMTLLGVSSMSATTTELKISNNLQTKNHAFQAAESVVELVVDDAPTCAPIAALLWNAGGSQPIPQSACALLPSSIPSGIVSATTSLTYAGCNNTPEGVDLSGSDGASFKEVVQDVSVAITITGASGASIGQQQVISGRGTKFPGCPQCPGCPQS